MPLHVRITNHEDPNSGTLYSFPLSTLALTTWAVYAKHYRWGGGPIDRDVAMSYILRYADRIESGKVGPPGDDGIPDGKAPSVPA